MIALSFSLLLSLLHDSLSLSLVPDHPKSSSLRALALGGVNTPQLLFYNPREQKLTASGFVYLKEFATYK